MDQRAKHVSLFLSNLDTGGAQRVAVDLSRLLAERGHRVEILVLNDQGAMTQHVDPQVAVHSFSTRSTFLAWWRLSRHLGANRPDALISFMPHGNMVGAAARLTALGRTRQIMTEHNDPLRTHSAGRGFIKSRLMPTLNFAFYRTASEIVSVSNGVGDALADYFHLPRERIKTIYNPIAVDPVPRPQFVDHHWFNDRDRPVFLAAGRLVPAKGFDRLIQAFAEVYWERPEVRLIIRGEGPERRALTEMLEYMKIGGAVSLPGVTQNLRAEMSLAHAFVLSSRWEGFGLVLAEALAEGARVISVDCDYGPDEILRNGAVGRLIRQDDDRALFGAMLASLDDPAPFYPADLLSSFRPELVAERYEALLSKH